MERRATTMWHELNVIMATYAAFMAVWAMLILSL